MSQFQKTFDASLDLYLDLVEGVVESTSLTFSDELLPHGCSYSLHQISVES